jgi:protein-S-isoprenylcysteine O-methyltransferase Ste14
VGSIAVANGGAVDRREGSWAMSQRLADDRDRKPWWKGAWGEWLVVAQVALIGSLFLGPRALAGQPAWPFPFPRACTAVGGALMAGGAVLLVASLVRLGRGLTPLPYPKDGAELVQTGPFALVRHPMYSGGLVLGFGWALCVRSWLTLGYAVVLFVFLDAKSRWEERWLTERFPGYATYRRRVRKLIPFIY